MGNLSSCEKKSSQSFKKVPINDYDDSKWIKDSKFLDAPLFYAANTLKSREIKIGDGLRLDFVSEPIRGKSVVIKIEGDSAHVEVFTGQEYTAIVRIIDRVNKRVSSI